MYAYHNSGKVTDRSIDFYLLRGDLLLWKLLYSALNVKVYAAKDGVLAHIVQYIYTYIYIPDPRHSMYMIFNILNGFS